jgi:hypothetical protein
MIPEGMILKSNAMNHTHRIMGRWSAWISTSAFMVWMLSFILIAIASPLFFWTDLEAYRVHVGDHPQFFPYLAKFFMLLFSLAFPVLVISLAEAQEGPSRILARTGAAFALMFGTLSGMHYFVQLSAMRFAMEAGEYSGLEHFLQANPHSVMSSVNMLGWTLLLGSSLLFLWAAYRKFPGKLLRISLLTGGISCLAGSVGYLLQIDLLTFVSINLGMGGSVLLLNLSAIRFFKS